jgi:pSer/pThr/pTyr-binding forkhead associated (FHA) protein
MGSTSMTGPSVGGPSSSTGGPSVASVPSQAGGASRMGGPSQVGGPLPTRPPVTPGWSAAVDADAEYHARMQAQAEPGTDPIPLPPFVPPRRFPLDSTQALVGRRSRSRGIEPDIDLSGPPADPAVSHAHALLMAQPDGTWAVVDLDSANGTFINDENDPIPPNTPRPLNIGDRVHLGAFTTITLQHTSTQG